MLADAFSVLAFGAAIVLLLGLKANRAGWLDVSLKYTTIATLFVYFSVGVSDTLGSLNIAKELERLEDYTETLYPVLALFVVFILYAAQQYHDAVRAQNALASTHGLMMDVVDSVVAGILFLDDAGNIAFANEAAKEALDLVEHPSTGEIIAPRWAHIEVNGARVTDLAPLVSSRAYADRSVAFVWETGWRVPIYVSGRPLRGHGGKIGGFVISFEVPGHRTA